MGTGAFLDFYGLTIECQSHSCALTAELVRPFKFFVRPDAKAQIQIIIKEEAPPYHLFPTINASFFTPRNVVYKDGDRKIIDYFGKGIAVTENQGKTYEIFGLSQNFLLEVFYLLVLSLLGQHCDREGLLRVHALAVSYHDRAILLLLPQGGGKSTMAFQLLNKPDFLYLSDDDPIIDRAGRVLPFPRPLGVLNSETLRQIPQEYLYMVDRMEFGIKHYVDIEYWGRRIEERHLSDILLFIGKRVLNGVPSVRPVSKLTALRTLCRDAVVGVGLYQGLEFLLSHSSWDAVRKIPVLMKRFLLAAKLANRSTTYEFTLSAKHAENCAALISFLQQQTQTTASHQVLTAPQTSEEP